MAQDDYYYEIQLTNKQLVFYFMAGATGLILSFLAGVMVGRGVESPSSEAQAAKPVREERIVTEEPAKPAASPPSVQQLTYAQRLESEKADESLEKPTPAEAKRPPAAKEGPAKETKPAGKKGAKESRETPKEPEGVKPKPAAEKPSPPPAATTRPSPPASEVLAPPPTAAAKPGPASPGPVAVKAASGTFTIQVGAFRDRGSAESVAARLKQKGFATYVVPPETDGGLFNVRVGSYAAKADAERIRNKLRDEEKFNPFIVRN